MEFFVHDTDWNGQFLTPAEYALEHQVEDGETFELVRVSVAAKTTYRMVGGNAVPESLAFVQTLTPNGAIEGPERSEGPARMES